MTTRDPYRGLVMAVSNTVNGVLVSAYLYDHDALGRVVSRNDDIFGYNPFSELTSAAIGSNVCHYAYDGIGNAQWTDINGILTLYHTNPLNQYTNILRTSSPPCELEYDPDGNMTNDGIFTYIWDGENRLIAVYNDNALVISNAYDHQSRRVLRITPNETRAFLYDGWNLVQETITTSSSTTTNHYVWGKDLSGTLQGAGGVGGLLAVCVDNSCYFPLYDNNGNITAYVAEGGVVVAEYIYDAFGNTISQSGSMADTFPHRFSTKYYDAETGFYYYGYRFYSPALMRWLNRDPIGEKGGANEYAFVKNKPINTVDKLGLSCWTKKLYDNRIPNPANIPNGRIDFTIWLRYEFIYHPADSKQVWLINSRAGSRVEQVGSRCYITPFELDPVIDVNDIVPNNFSLVDRQSLAHSITHDNVSYYELNIISIHGFSPKGVERPTGGNQLSDPGTCGIMLDTMLEPTDVTKIRYVYSNPSKCCACKGKLPINFKHESLSVGGVGWWGTTYYNIIIH